MLGVPWLHCSRVMVVAGRMVLALVPCITEWYWFCADGTDPPNYVMPPNTAQLHNSGGANMISRFADVVKPTVGYAGRSLTN
jgi:hypothetical protein